MPIRKRLLGFAFASSDMLLELSHDGRVTMALGAGPSAAHGPDRLQNTQLANHVLDRSQAVLAAALTGLKPGARTPPIEIVMICGPDRARRAILRAFVLPELAPSVSCAVSYDGPAFHYAPGAAPPVLTAEAFLDRARQALSGPKANRMSVAFVDIDGLAQVQREDDRAAKRVEAALQSASVDGASAARLTPERYALLRDRAETRDIAGELNELARAEGLALSVSCSDTPMADCPPVNALRALRYAVENCLNEDGRGPEQDFDAVLARTLREAEAFRAVVRDRDFTLHYQPIVDLRTGAVHHFEALARFPGDGGPAATIRMAEELGLIEGFDLAVAEKAVRRLRQPGAGLLKIAINVSAASLASNAYVEALLRISAAAPTDRRRLIVEVTESTALADVAAANRRLGVLREAGIHLCIDDFGAGAASFDYVQRLSVDSIKIDGRFVRGLERDPKAQTVIAHLVDMCGSLNLTTIAECVETDAAADILRSLGVDFGQGWLFGKAEAEPRTVLAASVSATRRLGAVETWG